MDKFELIARRISAQSTMTIRDLLEKEISVDVMDEQGTWSCPFDGKKTLTADGVARWSLHGTLDLPVTLIADKAIVSGLDSYETEQAVCALFNTLAGNVNKDTYAKYVEK